MGLIGQLVTHIFNGPLLLVPKDDPNDEHLIKLTTVKEMRIGRRPEIEVQVYVPATESRPNLLLPVLRRVTYDGSITRQDRVDHGYVAWPAINTEYFQVTDIDLTVLDNGFRRLQRAAFSLRIPDPDQGLDLDAWYGPADSDADATLVEVAYVRSAKLNTFGLMEVATVVLDGEADQPEFNRAWEALWSDLVRICQPEWLARPIEEYWEIPPRRFADLLLQLEDESATERPIVPGNPSGPTTVRGGAKA